MSARPSFWRDTHGTSAVEFVLAVPLFMLFVFGAIDVGGYAWKINKLEKATQMGTRFAVVTNPVAKGLLTEKYLNRLVNPANSGSGTMTQGQAIPAGALGLVTCKGATTCECTTAPCLTDMSADTTAYQNIVSRMASFDSAIGTANGPAATVEFRGSGLGFAGDPGGMEIAPLVTVRLSNAKYQPILGLFFKTGLTLPDFSFTLPMEDGSGTASN